MILFKRSDSEDIQSVGKFGFQEFMTTSKKFFINKSGNRFANGVRYFLEKNEEIVIERWYGPIFYIVKESESEKIVLTIEDPTENISPKVKEEILSDDLEVRHLQSWIKLFVPRGISRQIFLDLGTTYYTQCVAIFRKLCIECQEYSPVHAHNQSPQDLIKDFQIFHSVHFTI